MLISPITNSYYTKQTLLYKNNKKQISFSGVGLYEKNDAKHAPTKKDLTEINKINQKREPNKKIEPDDLFKTFEQYDKINKQNGKGNYYLETFHGKDRQYFEGRILLKSDLENISENSPLYRFKYVQDLKKSESDQDFYKKMLAQLYKGKIEDIKDNVILDYIYGGDCCTYFANTLLDAINTCEGKYISFIKERNDDFKSLWGKFDLYLQAQNSTTGEILSGKTIPFFLKRYAFENDIPIEHIKKDIELKIKYKYAKQYCRNYGAPDEIKNHVYENYYLKHIQKDINITDEEINLCKQINKKYGTKVFLSAETTHLEETLKYIEKELGAWQKAGGDLAVIPDTIDFSFAEKKWYNNIVGTAQQAGKKIKLAGSNSNVKYALRHEIMHLNQYESDDKTFEEVKDGKYKEEFKKGGITSCSHIDYAHSDKEEYVAVASEGDTSKYSDEFKEALIKLGMPKWAFELDNI